MSDRTVNRGRLKLSLIALIFFAPLILAAWMYYGSRELQPVGRTNFGTLLTPIVNLNEISDQADLVGLTAGAADGRWALIYANSGACAQRCRNALYRMRQSRLMLGNDMTRVVRIFLHGDIAPDKVWLGEQHKGLITINNEGLDKMLDLKRPERLGADGLFLVDPLGNLVMYFAADLLPEEMVSDLKHLLELSRIG